MNREALSVIVAFVVIMAVGFGTIILVALLGGCNIPDPSNLHLAECMRQCNANAKACIDAANVELEACQACPTAVESAETCGTNLIDCVAECVQEAEDALK